MGRGFGRGGGGGGVAYNLTSSILLNAATEAADNRSAGIRLHFSATRDVVVCQISRGAD